jgi:hypothetical protein
VAYGRILARDFDVTALTSTAEAMLRLETGESWDAILVIVCGEHARTGGELFVAYHAVDAA